MISAWGEFLLAWSFHPCVHELLSTSLGWWKMASGMARLGLLRRMH